MGIPEDLNLLNRNIEKLKNDYEQFFQGTLKVPPHTTQSAVERLIRKYTGGGIHNAALRFQYQNLVAKYNSMQQLWRRRMRMKEEGITIGAPQRFGETPSMPQRPAPDPAAKAAQKARDKPFNATTREPQKEKEVVNSLFNEYVKAQQKTGQSKKVSSQGFHKLIDKQVSAIKKQYKCSGVNFRIQVQDGEVKLKAKPVK